MPRRASRFLTVILLLLLLASGISLFSASVPPVLAKGEPGQFKLLGSHKVGPPQPHTVTTDGGACAPNYCGTPPLSNTNHEPVVHDPHMYLIFWGSWWQSSAAAASGIAPGMQSLFGYLAGGDYNTILSQYTDGSSSPNNYVHNDVQWITSAYDTQTPPASLTIQAIGQEVLNVMAANTWPNTANTMVMVFPQPGTTYDSSFNAPGVTCGEHDYGTSFGGNLASVVFGMVRYLPDTGNACNYGATTTDSSGNTVESAVGDMQEVASHEYAEMATDPEVGYVDAQGVNHSAWVTSDGFEVADLCNWGAQSYVPVNDSTDLWVSELWDNSAKTPSFPNGQCELQSGSGQEYLSPDTAPPFNGKHTVQGDILDDYQSLGGMSGSLREPTSEQTPLAGGEVSYFQGPAASCGSQITCGAIYWSASTGAYGVWGGIYTQYSNLGGPTNSLYGFPVSNLGTAGSGEAAYFGTGGYGPYASKAGIYWSATTGTHGVAGGIYAAYYGPMIGGPTNSLYGLPVSDQENVASGEAIYFGTGGPSTTPHNSKAGIYWSASTGAHGVAGGIYAAYYGPMIGGPTNSLYGLPVSDEETAGSGEAIYFGTGGSGTPHNSKAGIYWSAATGAHGVAGGIYAAYYATAIGGPTNSLYGLPVSDQENVASGEAIYFGTGGPGPHASKAGIYWSAATGAHGVAGGIYAAYYGSKIGGPTNSLYGLPVSDEETAGSGEAIYFGTGGAGPFGSKAGIYWSSSTGAHGVPGGIYAKYVSVGGPNSTLGLPVSDLYVNASGYDEVDFIGGSITWVNGTAVVTLNCVGTGKCS